MASDRAAEQRQPDERGAVLVLVAAAMGTIVVLVALVLDLGGARRDRDADQVAADAMALAGASGLGGSSKTGEAACQAAWDYVVVNLPTAVGAPSPSCNTFAAACVATTARQVTTTMGAYRVTFTHPVPDGNALLEGQDAATLDGPPCDRFGVRVEQTRDNLWMAGSVDLDLHAVSRYVRGTGDVQAPLVLLEPSACDVLAVGGNAQLTVSTATGEPGYIDLDSDGSGCASSKSIILDVFGSGKLTAGVISMWALAGSDADHAYDSTDKKLFDLKNPKVSPLPTPSSGPVGRSAMDWRYNCSPANGCPGPGPAYVDDLVAKWGTGQPAPVGTFTRWQADAHKLCNPTGDTVVPAGNWYIDCPTGLSTGGSITFQGGNIVTDGPIQASGGLRINCSDANPSDTVAPAVCPADPPAPSILFQRSGSLTRNGGNGNVEMRETFVYLAAGTLSMTSSTKLTWTAPNDPSYPFDDLLLWTESTTPMTVNGNADMMLEGILFAPRATMVLSGNMGLQALNAQVLVNRLDLQGSANLHLSPRADRMLSVGRGHPMLIR